MKNFVLTAITAIPLILNASNQINFECKVFYHADTIKEKNGKYRTKGVPDSSVTLKIYEQGKKIFVKVKGSTEANELIGISGGIGASYYAEITPAGNANMFTFFDDDLLTVSKSYNMFGIVKMSVQDQYRCR